MNKFLKIIVISVTVVLAVSLTAASAADESVRIFINNVETSFSPEPYLKNNRVMVPMRGIFERLGAEVAWDDNTQSVTAAKGVTAVVLTIGSDIMYTDGEAVWLDAACELVGDRTFVPLRAVSAAFGCEVSWTESENRVDIICDDSGNLYYADFSGVPDFGKCFGIRPVSVVDGNIFTYDISGISEDPGEKYDKVMLSEGYSCAAGYGYYVYNKGAVVVLAGCAGDNLFRVVVTD